MLTVGEILKKARLEKKISLEDTEKTTKIRQKYLRALEENDFDKLPPPTFTKGFIKNFSEFLGLNSKQVLMLYRREVDERKGSSLLPRGVSAPLNMPFFHITPNSFVVLLAVSFISSLFLYLVIQYKTIAFAPLLRVEEPKEKSIIKEKEIYIVGKTDSDAKVFINGQNVPVKEDGSFSQKIELQTGPNVFTVTSINKNNRSAKITRSLTVQDP